MIDIETFWENYAKLGKMIVNGELSREDFGNQIYAFSTFLSEMNHDYHYNGTYLPHYVDEFWAFLECFYRKYPIVKTLFFIASSYSNVSLVIDRYWQQDCTWNNEEEKSKKNWKVCPSYEKRLIFKDELLIECSVLCGTKRFIYQSKIKNDENETLEEQRLREFLDNKALLKDAEE